VESLFWYGVAMPLNIGIINTTASQDTDLDRFRTTIINPQRVAQGQATYSDNVALCRAAIIDQLQSWGSQLNSADLQAISAAYILASPATKAQVKADLGIS
jgi:hypothetical protein